MRWIRPCSGCEPGGSWANPGILYPAPVCAAGSSWDAPRLSNGQHGLVAAPTHWTNYCTLKGRRPAVADAIGKRIQLVVMFFLLSSTRSLHAGTLRGVRFHNRPAHADQLHVELWWHGFNLARDAGTYLYNSPPPWQNAFDRTRLHNTVTVNDQEQMQRISRFLWLDQAQAAWQESSDPDSISASHNGYRHLGITHQRTLEYLPGTGFIVSDTLSRQQTNAAEYEYCVHWLLPDWNWVLVGQLLTLTHENYKVQVDILARSVENENTLPPVDVSLIRAGKTFAGQRQDEILGWESDTYGEKHPALSFSSRFKTSGSIKQFIFFFFFLSSTSFVTCSQ